MVEICICNNDKNMTNYNDSLSGKHTLNITQTKISKFDFYLLEIITDLLVSLADPVHLAI